MATDRLSLDSNGFYILLFDVGDDCRFHWVLYHAQSPDSGIVSYLLQVQDTDAWVFETKTSADVGSSRNLIVAVKLAVIEPELADALSKRLAQIPIGYSARFREDVTCRVWVKEALFALDDEGYIKLIKSIDDIEMEANTTAMLNKYRKQRSVIKSAGSSA